LLHQDKNFSSSSTPPVAIVSALHHPKAEAMASGGGEALFAMRDGAEVQKLSQKTTFLPTVHGGEPCFCQHLISPLENV